MQLQSNKFGLSIAGVVGLVYVICAAVVALAPEFASQLASSLTHLTSVEAREVTVAGFASGLIQALVYGYIGGWLFVWAHNRSVR